MMKAFEELVKITAMDLAWHETWLVFGCEQHKKYWWVAIGDCSCTYVNPAESKGDFFSGSPFLYATGQTLNEASQKLLEQLPPSKRL